MKDEVSLHKLGILSKQSPFGSRTGSELCARALGKTSQFLQEKMMKMDLKVLNFAFDAATVSGEHVPWFVGNKYVTFTSQVQRQMGFYL